MMKFLLAHLNEVAEFNTKCVLLFSGMITCLNQPTLEGFALLAALL